MAEHYNFDVTKPAHVAQVLGVLVACAGDQDKARKLLSLEDREISREQIAKLRQTHGDEYAALAENYGPKLEAAIIRDTREIAARAVSVQLQAVLRAEETVGELKPSEAAKAARDLAHVSGQNVDQVLKLTGRPTQITEDRTVRQIANALVARKLLVPVTGQQTVEGTAEEVDDADAG